MFHHCKTLEDIKKLHNRLACYLHPDFGGEEDLMDLVKECMEVKMMVIEAENRSCEISDHQQFCKRLEDVQLGDEDLKIISHIKEYSKNNKKFNMDYVNSIVEFLEKRGYITDRQYNSLVKAYYSFRMNRHETPQASTDLEK